MTTTSREWVKATTDNLPPLDKKVFIRGEGEMLSGKSDYILALLGKNWSIEWLEEKEVTVTTDAEIEKGLLAEMAKFNGHRYSKDYINGLKFALKLVQSIPSKEVEAESLREKVRSLRVTEADLNQCSNDDRMQAYGRTDCINDVIDIINEHFKSLPKSSEIKKVVKEETVGIIISEAIRLHGFNPDIVEKQMKLTDGTLKKIMSDEYYTNSVPVVLFSNLLKSLYIPFDKINSALLPTFKLLLSKETTESIKAKNSNYRLWENEESLLKYAEALKGLMNPLSASKEQPL